MFDVALENGRYRFYQKYFHETEGVWKQVSTTLDSNSAKAQAKARRILIDKIEKAQESSLKLNEGFKVLDVLPEWLAIRKAELKESTYKSQYCSIRDFEVSFGKVLLTKVNHFMLQQFLMKNKSVSPEYRVIKKTIISLFFDYCVKVGYILENPVSKVVLPKAKKTLGEIRRKQEKFLTLDEANHYFNYIWEHGRNPVFNALAEILYWTGLRSAEALALGDRFTNFEECYFDISHNLYGKISGEAYILTSPKTLGSYRKVYFNKRVLSLIEGLQGDSEFYFANKKGIPYRLETFNNYLKSTFSACGVSKGEDFKLTSHVLRHSHITLLVEQEVPLKLIMERVGHTDEKTTLGIYTHVTQSMRERLTKTLDGLTFELT